MDEKSYLDQLVDYLKENQRKSNEGYEALINPSRLQKKVKANNPNLPESDVRDYVKSAGTETMMNMAEGVAMGSPALKVGSAIEGQIARHLPEVSRFRALLDNPVVQKIREPFKAQRNMDLMRNAEAGVADRAARIKQADDLFIKGMDDSVAAEKKAIEALQEKELQGIIQKTKDDMSAINRPALDLEATQPVIPNELIEEVLRKKRASGQ